MKGSNGAGFVGHAKKRDSMTEPTDPDTLAAYDALKPLVHAMEADGERNRGTIGRALRKEHPHLEWDRMMAHERAHGFTSGLITHAVMRVSGLPPSKRGGHRRPARTAQTDASSDAKPADEHTGDGQPADPALLELMERLKNIGVLSTEVAMGVINAYYETKRHRQTEMEATNRVREQELTKRQLRGAAEVATSASPKRAHSKKVSLV